MGRIVVVSGGDPNSEKGKKSKKSIFKINFIFQNRFFPKSIAKLVIDFGGIFVQKFTYNFKRKKLFIFPHFCIKQTLIFPLSFIFNIFGFALSDLAFLPQDHAFSHKEDYIGGWIFI